MERLSEINSVAGFMNLNICQGLGWSDTKILKASNFTVTTGSYQELFKMVVAKRCDAYPRAVFEAFHEVAERAETMPELSVDRSILIRYRLASFIFVNPNREELAQAIERGLEIAMQDGSFQALFESAAVHIEARENLNEAARHCLEIENPFLTPETAAIPPHYWAGFSFDTAEGESQCRLVGRLDAHGVIIPND